MVSFSTVFSIISVSKSFVHLLFAYIAHALLNYNAPLIMYRSPEPTYMLAPPCLIARSSLLTEPNNKRSVYTKIPASESREYFKHVSQKCYRGQQWADCFNKAWFPYFSHRIMRDLIDCRALVVRGVLHLFYDDVEQEVEVLPWAVVQVLLFNRENTRRSAVEAQTCMTRLARRHP